MAKKKAETPEAARAEKPATAAGKIEDGSKQAIILVYKADSQVAKGLKDWLAGLADHVGAPVTVTVDMALKAFAESKGYKPMPRRRVR